MCWSNHGRALSITSSATEDDARVACTELNFHHFGIAKNHRSGRSPSITFLDVCTMLECMSSTAVAVQLTRLQQDKTKHIS